MLFANMFIPSFSFLDRCRQKLTFAHLHTIHDQFWTITEYDARRQFAYSLIVKKRFNVEGQKTSTNTTSLTARTEECESAKHFSAGKGLQ